MTSIVNQLPLITIQHDFPQVIKEIQNGLASAEDIWISCYLKNSHSINQSVHGKVRITSFDLDSNLNHTEDHLPCLEARDGIQCQWADPSFSQLALVVSCEALSIRPTLVSFPFRIMKQVQPKGIECMDVNGEWLVTGGKNGNLSLDSWKNSNPNQHRIGRGHVSDITSCQFFPSGEVILTTSLDMSARIYSIHPDPAGKPTKPSQMLNVRTFAAPHGRSIPTSSIIGRGKEIITACKDGKIRIWNVSESKVIAEETVISNDSDDILSMEVASKRFLNRLGELGPSPCCDSQLKEAIHDQFIAIGLSSGALHFAHIPSLKPVRYITSTTPETGNSAIDTLAISKSGEMIAYGTRSGTVTISTLDWQITQPEDGDEPIQGLTLHHFTSWTRTETGINSLRFSNDDTHLLVAGGDGLPYCVAINSNPFILHEFAGFDSDPLSSIRQETQSGLTFIAALDGSVSIYK